MEPTEVQSMVRHSRRGGIQVRQYEVTARGRAGIKCLRDAAATQMDELVAMAPDWMAGASLAAGGESVDLFDDRVRVTRVYERAAQ